MGHLGDPHAYGGNELDLCSGSPPFFPSADLLEGLLELVIFNEMTPGSQLAAHSL